MKNFLHKSLRALFLSLTVLLSLPILAVEVKIDGIWYNLESEAKQAEVTYKGSLYDDYDEYSGEVVIPESVEHEGITYSVTSIGGYAFYYCSGLTSVTIGNSVKSIGDGAFAYCEGLTSVSIGNSVKSIGEEAFAYCSGLTSVTIPDSVESIGDYVFERCYALTSVTIPNSVTNIGDYAFCHCFGLTSVTIPNSVTSLEEAAFAYCSGLTSVTIPNSVTSIGECAFLYCSGLTSVTISNSVTSIGERAFSDCSGLQDVFCYAEKMPSADTDAFDGSHPENATLHVPAASIESYKSTKPWSSFDNIVALTEEETGIDEVKGENANVKTAVYDLSGRRVQKAQKGIFIQNGKVVVK